MTGLPILYLPQLGFSVEEKMEPEHCHEICVVVCIWVFVLAKYFTATKLL